MLSRALPMPSRLVLLAHQLHQLTEGYPRRPLYTLLAAVSVPLYTSYVLLLQAVNTVEISNTTLALGAGLVFSTAAWFINRTIKNFDDTLKDQKESLEKLAREQGATATLVGYLKERLDKKEADLTSLNKSFHEIDKHISALLRDKQNPH